MIRIGVVSDTHSFPLPDRVIRDFKKVDFIIHAGDFCTTEDLKILSNLKEVKAVYGNMDDASIRKLFPKKQLIPCEKCVIGLFHGEGPPHSLLDCIAAEFKGDKVDAIIFGHSHEPLNKEINNILYFNPGSPNDKVTAPYCSYGMIEVEDKKIKGKIIRV